MCLTGAGNWKKSANDLLPADACGLFVSESSFLFVMAFMHAVIQILVAKRREVHKIIP
jgi:hypothetical protein